MRHIFIVNPYAGREIFADDLRTKLAKIKGLDYFVFNTRYAGHEVVLIKRLLKIFEDEKLRFYCCGGSGTMRNILNGFDDLSQVEIAFYPCGMTNDFLKVFGEDEVRFRTLENLIDGDVIDVDYIKSNAGVSLNSLSTGLDALTLSRLDNYRFFKMFGGQVPYTIGILAAIFLEKPSAYEIYIDGKKLEGKFAEIFMGNGHVFGGNMYFDKAVNVTDGKAVYCIIPDKRGFKLLKVLKHIINKDIDTLAQHNDYGYCKKLQVRRQDGESFYINQDGEKFLSNYWEAEVIQKGLHFVVPKGVTL